jgi:hypothetical protein
MDVHGHSPSEKHLMLETVTGQEQLIGFASKVFFFVREAAE